MVTVLLTKHILQPSKNSSVLPKIKNKSFKKVCVVVVVVEN